MDIIKNYSNKSLKIFIKIIKTIEFNIFYLFLDSKKST